MNLVQRLSLRITGRAYIGPKIRPGWKRSLPFYEVRCKVHDLIYEDYLHGWEKETECPKCREERIIAMSYLSLEAPMIHHATSRAYRSSSRQTSKST